MASVSTLDYADIRSNFVQFLKQDPYYKDFNFDASNISRLLNILAYDSMYNGFYMKMLLDESMADSAKTLTALIGHANSRNYLTKFITAAKSFVNVVVPADTIDTTDVQYIQIYTGQKFKGTDNNNKTIYFISAYDTTLLYDSVSNTFKGSDFLIIQGLEKTTTYTVSSLYQKYLINDNYCDPSTIIVKVRSSSNAVTYNEYIRNFDFYDVGANDLCYYITASTSGLYQIHFGQDSFGREPKLGEYIEISYIKTDGSSANDANKFSLVLSKDTNTEINDINYYSNLSTIRLTTTEASSGGLDAESTEELRFNILNFSRVRGRALTSDDIKAVIMAEFRDVESINVWSGGTSEYRQYGKTYISIKPKTGELLTNTSQQIITDMLVNKYGTINRTDLIFVDPNFTDIILNINFKIDKTVTSSPASTIKTNIISYVNTYNKNVLSKFDVNFYDSDLVTYIKSMVAGLTTVYTDKTLQKTLELNYSTGLFKINFANQIKSITSDTFTYGSLTVKLISDNSYNVWIYDVTNSVNVINIGSYVPFTGVLTITIPQYVSAENINIQATPVYPDVSTVEYNIVRIKTITATEV